MSEILERQGVTIVVLSPIEDTMDLVALQQLGDLLLQAVAKSPNPRLVIDFSKVKSINSNVIEAVFRAWKRIKERHGHMALCGLNAFCAEVLEITKLTRIWTICDTQEAAVRAAASGG
jgi:anti-anti-sigma factor